MVEMERLVHIWTISDHMLRDWLACSPTIGGCILAQSGRTGPKSAEISPSAVRKVGDAAWQIP